MSVRHCEAVADGLKHFVIVEVVAERRALFATEIHHALNVLDRDALVDTRRHNVDPIIGAQHDLQTALERGKLVVNIFLGVSRRIEERNFQRHIVNFRPAVDNAVVRVIFFKLGVKFGRILFAAQVSVFFAAPDAQDVVEVFSRRHEFVSRLEADWTAENFRALVHDKRAVFRNEKKIVAISLERPNQRRVLPTACRCKDNAAPFEFGHHFAEACGQFIVARQKRAVHVGKNYLNHRKPSAKKNFTHSSAATAYGRRKLGRVRRHVARKKISRVRARRTTYGAENSVANIGCNVTLLRAIISYNFAGVENFWRKSCSRDN